ncbi:MAG TPA: isoleucine--tRNA ligase [Bacillota bacterium]|nr:isoleucine--tRNA ligase [Bacillota bacterium]
MYKNLSDKPIAQVQMEQANKWQEEGLLDRCVSEREGCPNFIFYEGPPTANGKPGIHHVLSRTLKDSVLRYKTMRGYRVGRKAGWDTHGLAVEIEVEKQLGFKGKQDIESYGMKEFNEKCRESVFSYEKLWREMTHRMGYLVNMDEPYITLDNDYIETCWWIIKEFFKAGLIYEGHKILPYCPRCGTGLASHEVAQGYKNVKVNTLIVSFKSKSEENTYFLAWTTTAWTLAANVAISVGPDIDYVKAEQNGKFYYVAKALAEKVLSPQGEYRIVAEMKGKDLEYMEYEQLMPFVEVDRKAFFVTCMDYVSTEDGTGIVHTAPAFGEDDYVCGRQYGLPVVNPVDEEGKYTATPWKGRFIMEDGLDIEIMKYLASEDKVYSKEKLEHNYPHCWRCHTPLVYYANPSWYIEMTKLKDQLVANNKSVNWYPEHVGEGRFGNWLADVKDWAISRSRFWGTPINIWRCGCGHLESVGSRAELVEKAIEDIDESIELHRPYVDEVHIKCPKCGKPMSRIPEVMDCWFDSGAMPFGQIHYPFEHKEDFDTEYFPADFICEGIDQTRGWFYSLIAISTFIKGKSPYRNVLVNDLVLDKEGKKMSKHIGNTVDPFVLFDKYGADATRWYMMHVSPVWFPTRFDEDGLIDVQGRFFGTLRNVYNFFTLYANNDEIDASHCFVDYAERPELDRWILSRYNRVVAEVIAAMDAYDHNRTVHLLQDFVVEDLSNWYIRRARRRFYADGLDPDKKSVYATTYEVLCGVAKLIAPFAPFISDELYINLTGEDSVHLAAYPVSDPALADPELEKRMDLVRSIVNMGRGIREKSRIKVRQPLSELLVDGSYEDSISYMAGLIKEELNVKNIVFEKDMDTYLNYALKPDFRVAGPLLGGKIKAFGAAISKLAPKEVMQSLERDGKIVLELNGEATDITAEMVSISVSAKEGFTAALENGLSVILDTTVSPELEREGLARELVSKVQQMRKQKAFNMTDRISVRIEADEAVAGAVEAFREYICSEVLADELGEGTGLEIFDLNGHKTGIYIERI